MTIRVVPITAKETIPLRHRVLWPDKPPAFCMLEEDDSAWHFGAFLKDALVCTASLYPDGERMRLRKFATEEAYQGQGIGSMVFKHLLTFATQEGCTGFWCDARESAMGFYQKFGLQPVGERFFKGPVPYFRMQIDFNLN